MRCKHCHKQVTNTDIYCPACGRDTALLSEGLSFNQTRKEVIAALRSKAGGYYSTAIFVALVSILPSAAVLWFSNNYWLNNLVLVLLLPLALLPAANYSQFLQKPLKLGSYFKLLNRYPKFLLFCLYNAVYFFVLKLVCTGLPFFEYEYDPILNLVELVMVFYWLAIVLPVPVLMEQQQIDPLTAIWRSYRWCSHTRWQQFYAVLWILALLVVGVLTAGFGLVAFLPWIWAYLPAWHNRLSKYKVLQPEAYSWEAVRAKVQPTLRKRLSTFYSVGYGFMVVGGLALFVHLPFLTNLLAKGLILGAIIITGFVFYKRAEHLRTKLILENQ